MSFPCAWCGKHVQNLFDRFDIRLDARRADTVTHPHSKTVLRLCKHHMEELFAAVERGRVEITVVGDVVKVDVMQGSLL